MENKKVFLEELNKVEVPKIKFVVNEFRLKESLLKKEGDVYEIIEEYGNFG